VGGVVGALGREVYGWLRSRIKKETEDTERSRRLVSVTQKLKDYAFRADQMHEAILAERVATESLSDHQQHTRSSRFDLPDARAWHLEVQSFIERELGPAQATEFAGEVRPWDQYDPSDRRFLMSFLGRKKNSVLGLARRISESDLLAAEEPARQARLSEPKWQCCAGTVLPASLALLTLAAFEILS